MTPKRTIALATLLLCCLSSLFSQDIEGLLKEAKSLKDKAKNILNDSLSIKGGVSTELSFNQGQGDQTSANPFNYRLSGELNISMYGLTLPVSLNFANKRVAYNYNLPPIELPSYSFAGLSPTYKWATLHVGDRAMTFSPYTLSGHGFRGLGTELKPGKFFIAAMYGRLQRADAQDLNSVLDIDPLYRRMAWSTKLGYDTGTDHIYAIVFKGWDDVNSLTSEEAVPGVNPAENAVVSIQGKKKLSEKFSFSVDYALSAYNDDQRFNEATDKSSLLGLFTPRVNSEYYNAIKSSLAYQLDWGDISLNHEWVQPGYKTLGALFFNNDFENYTIGNNLSLFDKKLTIGSNFGVERNNLSKTEEETALRLIGSINATVMIGESLNINASFSNLKNTNKQSALAQPQVLVDSIILTQVSQSGNLTTAYVTGADKNSTIAVSLSFNKSNSIENDEVKLDQSMTSYTANLSHSYVFTNTKLTMTSALLATQNIAAEQTTTSYAPTLDFKMPFFDNKMTASTTLSYIRVYLDQVYDSNIINWQSAVNYTFREKHNFGLSISIVDQEKVGDLSTGESTGLFTSIGRLNYRWSF